MKNKGLIITLIVIGVIALIAIFSVSKYNGLVTAEETVDGSWAQVENQYQRRADLIPNLVNTVKGYATHEKETLQAVMEARSKATSTQVNFSDANSVAEYNAAQGQLSQALGKLMVVAERYPDLKANQNFMQLQVQLEGTENRISTERRKFNETTKTYNTNLRKFPTNIFASMFGFEKKEYFEAQEGSEKAPEVKF